jgi:hypothetical protein
VVDVTLDLRGSKAAMMSNKPSQSKNFVCPETTLGACAARRVCAEANKLTERQREDLSKRGMQIVYGGTGTEEKVGAGR